ncbi:D-inositol 3-phosphate glycosyltransferase-like [Acropora palmata]|uniref:D-inositol 3-phosphate glycosyltransferase-like n=1 Tax=Acropora palmata TaxID=6131 RepID=UPI003DA162FE
MSRMITPEDCLSSTSSRKLKVTLLTSEWGSSKGGLSTINRELATQLAKHDNVEVCMYLPRFSDEDKNAAADCRVSLVKAKERAGYNDPIDWLAFIPRDHQMDVVIGHGIHLGRQVPLIKEMHPECKWVQVVHTDPEELGMFKTYPDPTAKGEKKHEAEVKLCLEADHVVAVGPKLTEAFARYLRQSCGDVLNFTPGIFSEFAGINQAAEERKVFHILLFGRGDGEDFQLKGYDIAAKAVAMLNESFKLVFVGAPHGKEEEVKATFLDKGISRSHLIVRSVKERKQLAEQFYQADLVIMPSRTEGFGLAALEALSAGLPVLVSGNSGLGEALEEVPFGTTVVVKSEDPAEWAKAIRGVRSKRRSVRLKEASVLCKMYSETYKWEEQCCKLIKKLEVIRG